MYCPDDYENNPHVCCPICGYEFETFDGDEQQLETFICPTQHYGKQTFTLDELIGTDDDYEWCQ